MKEEKKLANLGISLVRQPKKAYREPIDRRKQHSKKADALRGSLSRILIKKPLKNGKW